MPLCFLRASAKVRVFPLLIAVLGVAGMLQTHALFFMLGYSAHVWRMLNKVTLHQEGAWMFSIMEFQCVADQV